MSKSYLEELFMMLVRELEIPEPVREFRFSKPRKWAFDFAWPEHMLAIEIEGGNWTRGRHVRPLGFADDCEKYNRALDLGWRVYRYPGDEAGKAAKKAQELLTTKRVEGKEVD